MRVLHTSDWHLGRSLHGHNLLDDQRFVLEQLLTLIREQQVQLLLLAGDVYDRSLPPDGAVALFDEFIEQLIVELGVTTVVIPGNHDSALRLGFGAALLKPQGLHLLTDLNAATQPLELEIGHQSINLFGLPYASPELMRATFPEASIRSADEAMSFMMERASQSLHKSVPNLLMAHCFVAGGFTSESERPLSVGGADQVSVRHFDAFDYVALGHLHRPHQQARPQVRYSGSLLKYSVSEQDHGKSVVLFDITDNAVQNIETVALQPRRDVRTVQGSLQSVLAAGASDERADDYVQIVLEDDQALHDVHGRLASVYPNRLQVLRPNVVAQAANAAQTLASVQRGELAMFADFYQYSAGRDLAESERALLEQGLAALRAVDGDSADIAAKA